MSLQFIFEDPSSSSSSSPPPPKRHRTLKSCDRCRLIRIACENPPLLGTHRSCAPCARRGFKCTVLDMKRALTRRAKKLGIPPVRVVPSHRPSPTATNTDTASVNLTPAPAPTPTPPFDPNRPSYPHPTHMRTFLTALADLGSEWKGLDAVDFWRRFHLSDRECGVSAIVANAVAGFAARYVPAPASPASEDRRWKRHQNGAVYRAKAKELLRKEKSLLRPTLENVYALVFMAWSAYGSQDSEFHFFGYYAVAMLQALGSSEERARLFQTWFMVARLDSTISWVTGEPMNLKSEEFNRVRATDDLGMASSTKMSSLIDHIAYTNQRMFDVRTRLQNLISSPPPSISTAQRELHEIQLSLEELIAQMPQEIRFTLANLHAFGKQGQGTTFIILHLSLYTFVIMANCPSIFKRLRMKLYERLDVSCSAAGKIVTILQIAKTDNPKSISAIPCLDLLLGAAAWALLKDCRVNRVPTTLGQANRHGFAETHLEGCVQALDVISGMWQNLDTIHEYLVGRDRWEYTTDPDACYLGVFYSNPMAHVTEWDELNQTDHHSIFSLVPTSSATRSESESEMSQSMQCDWTSHPHQFDVGCNSESTMFPSNLTGYAEPQRSGVFSRMVPAPISPERSNSVNTFDFEHAVASSSYPLDCNRFSPDSSTSPSTPFTPHDEYYPSYQQDMPLPIALYEGHRYFQGEYTKPHSIDYDPSDAYYNGKIDEDSCRR